MKTVGEAEVDWYGIGPEHFAGMSRQEEIVEYLDKQGYNPYFIIRNLEKICKWLQRNFTRLHKRHCTDDEFLSLKLFMIKLD